MAIRSFHQAIGMVSVRQQLGLSGHWSEVAATTAMVWSAVAEVVSILRAHFQRWPGAAGGPSPPRRIAPAQWPNGRCQGEAVNQGDHEW